jgi:hypothetical protein
MIEAKLVAERVAGRMDVPGSDTSRTGEVAT